MKTCTCSRRLTKLRPKKYRSKDASRPLIIVRKAMRRDVSKMLRNFEIVASEQVYLGNREGNSEAPKGRL